MDSFEFAFSLFGLVLGLSVTEVISGFARVLRHRGKLRLGWLTPMLGLLLLVDLITFWLNAWHMRQGIPLSFEALLFGTAVASIYFLSASLVFPQDVGEWADLDDYFLRHKGQVMIGVIVANLMVNGVRDWVIGPPPSNWQGYAIALIYTSLGTVFILAKGKRLAGALLAVLLSLYVIFRYL